VEPKPVAENPPLRKVDFLKVDLVQPFPKVEWSQNSLQKKQKETKKIIM
jgi:hypothetical protein